MANIMTCHAAEANKAFNQKGLAAIGQSAERLLQGSPIYIAIATQFTSQNRTFGA
jgi:hypothetical protein